ncbi:MAG: efflux RND transporter periplasmic adaptor subunit [Patescibacteria group bacterium]
MRRNLSRLLKLFKNRWIVAITVVVIIVLVYIFTRGGSGTKIEFAVATIGDVIEKVSVTGKVSPLGKADLSFEKGGVVARITVKVGDYVKRDDLIASLNSADDAAALASAQAQLAEVSRGLRPEEFAADQATMDTASTTLGNAKKDAVNAVRDGYVKAQSAVVNYADTFFTNPQSANPTISIRVQSTNFQTAINNNRVLVSDILAKWKSDTDNAVSGVSDVNRLISKSEGYLNVIKSFLNNLSSIVNDLNPGNSGLTQSVIDTYVTNMNTALATLTQAITSVTTADTALKSVFSSYNQALNEFSLQKAGSSPENIATQSAKVAQAQAQLAKNSVISPIDGIITRADPNLGEFVSAGQSSFAVQSDGAFKIEAYVPEADIAKIALKNRAGVTLDAYGSNTIFSATVTMIDPAETVLEGVPTYKVTLQFVETDARIRSGMTANTDILTHKVDGVLTIPTRAVIDDAGKKSVRLLDSNGNTFTTVPVVTGLKGSDGTLEIKSGIKAGDKVVTYVK